MGVRISCEHLLLGGITDRGLDLWFGVFVCVNLEWVDGVWDWRVDDVMVLVFGVVCCGP